MHRLLIPVGVTLGLCLAAAPGLAQTGDGPMVLTGTHLSLSEPVAAPTVALPEPSDQALRRTELQRWMREYTAWKEWNDRWQGKPEPGWLGMRERRQKPDPPIWLFDECLADIDPRTTDECQLLESWKEDPASAQLRAQTLNPRSQGEDPAKTTFWNHVHLDALWLTPNSSVSYGVVGVHVTLKVAGRWQVFVAPGAILLNVPTRDGMRAWQPATDLGFSYRLIDVTLPGKREGTLHLNVARAWLLGGSESFLNSSVDLAGLSLTFK